MHYPDLRSNAYCATTVDNWEEPTGESQINSTRPDLVQGDVFFLRDIINILLKEPHGRVGLLIFIVLSAGIYLTFAFLAEGGALEPIETIGMLLFNLIVVCAGVLAYGRLRKK